MKSLYNPKWGVKKVIRGSEREFVSRILKIFDNLLGEIRRNLADSTRGAFYTPLSALDRISELLNGISVNGHEGLRTKVIATTEEFRKNLPAGQTAAGLIQILRERIKKIPVSSQPTLVN